MGLFTKLFGRPRSHQDGEDGKAFASPGSFAYGGKGGKGKGGQGGKGGDAVVIGSSSIAIGGKGGDVGPTQKSE